MPEPLNHRLLLDQTNIECMFVSVDDTIRETNTPSRAVVMRMVQITNERISAWLNRLIRTQCVHGDETLGYWNASLGDVPPRPLP